MNFDFESEEEIKYIDDSNLDLIKTYNIYKKITRISFFNYLKRWSKTKVSRFFGSKTRKNEY